MKTLQDIIDNCIHVTRDGHDDYGLWAIAQQVTRCLGIQDPEANKNTSLEVVRAIMAANVMPGYLGKGSGTFRFWNGTPDELYARIESEWPKGRIPNLSDDCCWFLYKSPET